MSFSVDWTPVAETHLISIWLNYDAHRQEVTAASAPIDGLLATNPLQNGTVLSEGLYVIRVAPLRALY